MYGNYSILKGLSGNRNSAILVHGLDLVLQLVSIQFKVEELQCETQFINENGTIFGKSKDIWKPLMQISDKFSCVVGYRGGKMDPACWISTFHNFAKSFWQ